MLEKYKKKLQIIKPKIKMFLFISKKCVSAIITIFFIVFLIKSQDIKDVKLYINYIHLCQKSLKLYDIKEKINEFPFFSICIPIYNMEKYIEKSFLSVLNQSFRDFELVIINDNSFDSSEEIIKNLQSDNKKIRLINHERNLGVYNSRVDAIKNSNGKYILFLDPDDLFANPKLLKELYEYNLNKNEDMIEFTVMIQEECNNKLYYPIEHRRNHFHNFKDEIVYQPHLSNIIFLEYNKYSDIFCRCIWNKMVRKQILDKTINFISYSTYDKLHFNFGEDTIINILNFEFASNYTNLNLLGYMYNVRSDSMSHTTKDKRSFLKMGLNMYIFYILFYKYIKFYNKDLNYLYFDLKAFDYFLNYIKLYSYSSEKKKPIIDFYKSLIKERNISNEFKKYAKNFVYNFINKA